MATEAVVRRIALALPEVTETSQGIMDSWRHTAPKRVLKAYEHALPGAPDPDTSQEDR